MAENNLHGTIDDSDSDLSGTMYEYQASVPNNAADINYNNAASGLSADNVQEAIDEIAQNGGNGEPGVGIESIEQTTTSTEDGGENIVTVTKTDGDKSTFRVRNGNKGSDGISPTVETSEIENGHEVTFNDVNGSKIFKVMDGAALLYVVSEGETIENARIAAKAAGARFIFNPYASNSTEFITATSFETLFNALNGAVLLWSGTWNSTTVNLTIAETGGTAGCTGAGSLSDYSLFLVDFGSSVCLSVIYNGALYGGGNYLVTGQYWGGRAFAFPVSGNSISYSTHKYGYFTSSTTTVADSTTTVRAVYGVPLR